MVKTTRIMKVAGLSFVGFCAMSFVADKFTSGTETAQIAGYCGAFLGALVGRGRRKRSGQPQNVTSGAAESGKSS